MCRQVRAGSWGLCGMLWLCASAAVASGGAPTEAESAALARLKGRLVGQTVWESNRDGGWHLYTMNADGTGARRLTSGPGSDTAACFSGDGRRILFTRALPGESPAVWIMDRDGTNALKLIDNASQPAWRKGDQAVEFSRKPDRAKDSWQTWQYDLATGEEREVFPPAAVAFEPQLQVATGNDDGTRFIAWSPRPRGTWVLSSDGRVQKHVHGGCEPRVSADQRYGYGVETAGRFVRFNLSDGEDKLPFNERSGPWSHTYFPYVSDDASWLAYGACPPDQHNQDTSDYEILVVPLENWATTEEPVRLTFNTRTDRCPAIFVVSGRADNPLPDGPYDVAGNPETNPPIPPLVIFSFPAEGARPDWGGASGLWPQVEGCQGTATFVPGDDAEGGAGGSTRIEYDIRGEPRSFSMWFTPGAGAEDLSAYDRFIIYAKGDVPSFTLVVKDGTADPEGASSTGIADYVVTGLTAEWRRFELPFTSFIPRDPSTRIDWRNIQHVGVALMEPYDALSGTLQVDNLRVLAAQ